MCANRSNRPPAGFSLVELLVVITIIGILMSVLLVVVQLARESARRTQCNNQIRQLALGCTIHEQYRGFYPTGGWGHAWVGNPDRGFDAKQPGGWIYNLLPFIEQANIHSLGQGATPSSSATASAKRMASIIPLMNCPSRRRAAVWPTATDMPHLRNPRDTDTVMAVARSDYAINAGSVRVFSSWEGPMSLSQGDSTGYAWPDTSAFNGISYLRSQVGSAAVRGGMTHTYMLGEKYLNPVHYYTGADPSDNESMYNGFCSDLHRYASAQFTPMLDRSNVPDFFRFGSAHPAGCGFAFCDGAVRTIGYDIDPQLHACYGDRESECSISLGP